MRAYQTRRCGKFHGIKTSDIGRGRRHERNPLSPHARRVVKRQLKRGDRQRAVTEELRIEREAEAALIVEYEAMIKQFEDECREPTEQERLIDAAFDLIEAERDDYYDYLYESYYGYDDDYYDDCYR